MLATGCAGTRLPATVSGGIDKLFPEPPHEILGRTKVDQAWIDETVEAGKSCCGWSIKPRPQSLDAPKAVVPAPAKPTKKKLWQRLRHPLQS